MFDFRYKKHNYIYNNLVELSRNIFFYKELKLHDKLENRIVIIFAHLSIILNYLKNNQKNSKLSQEIYDNIFLNIENNLREIGHGDVTVNKKMKQLNRIFHDLLVKFISKTDRNKINVLELIKYLYMNDKKDEIAQKLRNYFQKYNNFCFDIIDRNMIQEIVKFKY